MWNELQKLMLCNEIKNWLRRLLDTALVSDKVIPLCLYSPTTLVIRTGLVEDSEIFLIIFVPSLMTERLAIEFTLYVVSQREKKKRSPWKELEYMAKVMRFGFCVTVPWVLLIKQIFLNSFSTCSREISNHGN